MARAVVKHTVPRASALVWWETTPTPPVPVEELKRPAIHGTMAAAADAPLLLDLDIDTILDAALRYNYVTVRQLALWGSESHRRMSRHCEKLFRIGLLDRAQIQYRIKPVPFVSPAGELGTREHRIWEWAYALSQWGFAFLQQQLHPLALEWASDWRPRSTGESRKLSLAHELGRNDVALACWTATHRRNRDLMAWVGPREAYHRVPPATPGGTWQHVEPDSVLVCDNGRPLYLEYERSGRPDRLLKKAQVMRYYLASNAWKERYALQPWVVYAVPSGSGTQGRQSTYGQVAKVVQAAGANRYLILDATAWEQGHWEAYDGRGRLVSFWDTVFHV